MYALFHQYPGERSAGKAGLSRVHDGENRADSADGIHSLDALRERTHYDAGAGDIPAGGRMSEKVTVEYYSDSLLVRLIGAVDVPAKRKIEAAQSIGKAICKALGLNTMEAVLIDKDGNRTDQIVVWR